MGNAESAGLRRGEVAAAAEVNIETLRYYERRGLLDEPRRSPGGHRLYPPQAVTIVRVIKAAQRLGFTLDEVADLLDVGRHRHGRRVEPGLQRRAQQKLAEIEQRIDDLMTIRENLAAATDAGCDDLLACAADERCPIPFKSVTERSPTGHAKSGGRMQRKNQQSRTLAATRAARTRMSPAGR